MCAIRKAPACEVGRDADLWRTDAEKTLAICQLRRNKQNFDPMILSVCKVAAAAGGKDIQAPTFTYTRQEDTPQSRRNPLLAVVF